MSHPGAHTGAPALLCGQPGAVAPPMARKAWLIGADMEVLVEAFLLDFAGDLYGETITIEFIERLRGEARFDNVEALIEQMHADVARTRELLA